MHSYLRAYRSVLQSVKAGCSVDIDIHHSLYLKDLDMTHIAGEPAITRTPLTGKSALLPAWAEDSA